MVILAVHLHFQMPYVEGLKGRRKLLSSLKERLKKLNTSVIDLSGEYPKEAHLGVAVACGSDRSAESTLEHIRTLLDFGAFEFEYWLEYEIY